MSLAELFVAKQARRAAEQIHRKMRKPKPVERLVFEALEPQVLMSATPADVVVPQELVTVVVTGAPNALPNLDVDLNGQADALTDGIVIIRHLFGFTGSALTNGAVDPAGQRTDSAAITAYLESIQPALDINKDGQVDALTDGIALINTLFGFSGIPLMDTAGALSSKNLDGAVADVASQQAVLESQVEPVRFPQVASLIQGQTLTAGGNPMDVRELSNAEVSLDLPGDIVSVDGEVSISVAPRFETSLADITDMSGNRRFHGIDGRGMTAVIIDTGIDVDHPFFGPDADQNGVDDRIVFQWDFADNDADASDRNGHGSHIASLIGSEDLTYPGVAPEVNLIALKVFKDSGAGNFGYVEQALQWVVAHAADYHIDVVNMSLGDGQNWSLAGVHYGIGDELAALANEGVLVIAAAGNNFFTARSQPGVAYPAADPNVIGVGAVWTQDFGGPWRWSSGAIDFTTGADRIASFSQRDTVMTEIFAPGARLVGANQSGGTVMMQGTSQAAAYFSGTAILAQERAEKELGRRLTPEEFVHLVTQTGKPIIDGDDENDNVTNTGDTFARVDLAALGKGVHRFAEQEEEGSRHRDRECAIAFAQHMWVKDFVHGTAAVPDREEEELLFALPG